MSKEKQIQIKGWTFEQYPRDADLFSLPSQTLLKTPDYMITRQPIASSPGLAKIVFFLDRKDRGAWVTFGQFSTEGAARNAYIDLTNAPN